LRCSSAFSPYPISALIWSFGISANTCLVRARWFLMGSGSKYSQQTAFLDLLQAQSVLSLSGVLKFCLGVSVPFSYSCRLLRWSRRSVHEPSALPFLARFWVQISPHMLRWLLLALLVRQSAAAYACGGLDLCPQLALSGSYGLSCVDVSPAYLAGRGFLHGVDACPVTAAVKPPICALARSGVSFSEG
jgi:hypothetical protein